jgi:hypothetical protein
VTHPDISPSLIVSDLSGVADAIDQLADPQP